MNTSTANDVDDRRLLARADEFCQRVSLVDLDVSRLLALSREHGSDFAVAVAYQAVRRAPEHIDFIQRIESTSVRTSVQSTQRTGLGLVPNLGYFLDSKPQQAGAQVAELAGRLGFSPFTVPTSHTMDLKANGRLICDTLRERNEDRIVLISISKGSSDLKLAFNEPDADEVFRRVVAWINVCGLLDGTAIVNLVLDNRDAETEAQIIGWFKQRGEGYVHLIIDALRDCGRGSDRPWAGPLKVPGHIRTYHVAAFPLERHFRFEHSQILNQVLLQLGPNDCFALLADQINKPGVILPVWGSDHYIYQAVDLGQLIASLLQLVTEDCGLAD